jgi:hypothetical protein
MMLREWQLPKWLAPIVIVILFPLWGPFIGMLWLDNEGRALKRRLFGPRVGEWQRWFAWHPVAFDNGFGPTVWLETVERQALGSSYNYYVTYRPVAPPTLKDTP